MNLELYKQIVSNLSPEVTLRHDVDVSIEAAMDIAILDRELGRKSWFYFRSDNKYYTMSERLFALFMENGHICGAHIDTTLLQFNSDFFSHLIKLKKAWPFINSFTFHINGTWSERFTGMSYCGLRNDNLCSDGYVSDARGIMPEIPTKGVLNLHPEWWVYPGATPKEKIEYYFNQQKEKCLKEILPDSHL